jgi:hypothetical protein
MKNDMICKPHHTVFGIRNDVVRAWYIYGRQEIRIYTIFVGKPEGMMSLGRTRRRLKDNIKTDFKGTSRLQCSRIDC